ncbi:hypothetical protein [Escherichia phage vB-EcoP-XT32]|uniref:Uncharacterized protein n=1 Tax=Escherichia phage vB-EcoP-XT18 TaxID=3093889 RepID=A0ABZ0S395_9CAUD|nr:hypothetical protein [Escherichia phage vB-EcoP-XT18]WPK41981.1 hypothetical protein [Escherichia phage vB-EcoP-XT32]
MEEMQSDWCYRQSAICNEQGRPDEAEFYLELAELWKEREEKNDCN